MTWLRTLLKRLLDLPEWRGPGPGYRSMRRQNTKTKRAFKDLDTHLKTNTSGVQNITDPPTTIRYFPEQIVRAIKRSTEAALSISSSTRYPMPMLESSMTPIDLKAAMMVPRAVFTNKRD